MTIQEKYNILCNTSSDINELLPILKSYAEKCSHITEFGVRGKVSTYALLMGNPVTMRSYDIVNINCSDIIQVLPDNIDFKFINKSTLDIEIERTDLLFIDTLHNYSQLIQELNLHGNNVRKYIILHDTTTFGYKGETEEKGLWSAVVEWLNIHQNWAILERITYNNGLTILFNKTNK
jgi:hypothetical protein